MTAKRIAQGLIIATVLCFGGIDGHAQDYKLFLMVGGSRVSDYQSFTELFIPFVSTYATGGRGTLGIETPLKGSKIWGLEGSFAYGQSNLELTNENTSPATTRSYGLRNARAAGDFVARYPGAIWGVYPYAVAGLEFNLLNPTGAASSLATSQGFAFEPTAKLGSQTAVGYNFGGGFDWKFTKKIDVRIDVRDHVFASPTFGLPTAQPSTAGLPWFPVTGNARNLEFCIGLVYHFGKGRETAPPAASTPSTPSTEQAPSTGSTPSSESTSSTPSTESTSSTPSTQSTQSSKSRKKSAPNPSAPSTAPLPF